MKSEPEVQEPRLGRNPKLDENQEHLLVDRYWAAKIGLTKEKIGDLADEYGISLTAVTDIVARHPSRRPVLPGAIPSPELAETPPTDIGGADSSLTVSGDCQGDSTRDAQGGEVREKTEAQQ